MAPNKTRQKKAGLKVTMTVYVTNPIKQSRT
jgi:hypothetical protein